MSFWGFDSCHLDLQLLLHIACSWSGIILNFLLNSYWYSTSFLPIVIKLDESFCLLLLIPVAPWHLKTLVLLLHFVFTYSARRILGSFHVWPDYSCHGVCAAVPRKLVFLPSGAPDGPVGSWSSTAGRQEVRMTVCLTDRRTSLASHRDHLPLVSSSHSHLCGCVLKTRGPLRLGSLGT